MNVRPNSADRPVDYVWSPARERYETRDGTRYYEPNGDRWVPIETTAAKPRVLDKRTTFIVGLGLLAAIALLVTIALLNRSDGPATVGGSPYTQSYLVGPDAFLDEVKSRGMNHVDGDDYLLRAGYIVCDAVEMGYSYSEIAEELYYAANVTAMESQIFVNAAVDNLC